MDGTEEEFVPEDEAVDGPSALKKLREKLKKAVEEKQEYLDGWQRARADFANYKKEEATLYADRDR
jgi:molecular chaperone GrpE (heat shock protein)